MRTIIRAWPLLVAAALLGGCGGGGGGGSDPQPAPSDSVPAEASQGDIGLTGWLKRLAGDTADNKEPLDMGNFKPAVAEDTEPQEVD